MANLPQIINEMTSLGRLKPTDENLMPMTISEQKRFNRQYSTRHRKNTLRNQIRSIVYEYVDGGQNQQQAFYHIMSAINFHCR